MDLFVLVNLRASSSSRDPGLTSDIPVNLCVCALFPLDIPITLFGHNFVSIFDLELSFWIGS